MSGHTTGCENYRKHKYLFCEFRGRQICEFVERGWLTVLKQKVLANKSKSSLQNSIDSIMFKITS